MAQELSTVQTVLLYVMALLYVCAGANHFIHPDFYMAIMPKRLPRPLMIIYISGVAEILLALLLLPAETRIVAAWLLILLLIVIFPANIQMAVSYYQNANPYLWIAILRLPLQFVLIWWAYLYTRK